MRQIQSSEVKARLPQFLDDVERGETIIITRHGSMRSLSLCGVGGAHQWLPPNSSG